MITQKKLHSAWNLTKNIGLATVLVVTAITTLIHMNEIVLDNLKNSSSTSIIEPTLTIITLVLFVIGAPVLISRIIDLTYKK